MDKIRDLRNKQFFQISDEYLNGYAKLCGINATGVYLSLCRHVNKEQKCFPSKKLIGEELAISERSVYRALRILESFKIIKLELQGRKPNGSFRNTLYTLLDKIEWLNKPTATQSDGNGLPHSQQRTANDDTNGLPQVPNKDTHNKDTHIRKHIEVFPNFLNINYWNEWKAYRKEKGKTLTKRTIKLQWKMLEEFTKEEQKQIIEESIKNGWTGLFKLKNKVEIKRKITFSKHYENS